MECAKGKDLIVIPGMNWKHGKKCMSMPFSVIESVMIWIL